MKWEILLYNQSLISFILIYSKFLIVYSLYGILKNLDTEVWLVYGQPTTDNKILILWLHCLPWPNWRSWISKTYCIITIITYEFMTVGLVLYIFIWLCSYISIRSLGEQKKRPSRQLGAWWHLGSFTVQNFVCMCENWCEWEKERERGS